MNTKRQKQQNKKYIYIKEKPVGRKMVKIPDSRD